MKAITIIQPWATLIAVGEKKFETRSWATKHRGDIAIHAGKKIDKKACAEPEIKAALERHGYTADNLPTGAVVATANLSDCHEVYIEHLGDAVLLKSGTPHTWVGQGNKEFAFGWYETGRYAWRMDEVEKLSEPLPAKGQQGLWNLANQF